MTAVCVCVRRTPFACRPGGASRARGERIREMDFIHVHDNSRWGTAPAVMPQAEEGEIVYRAERACGTESPAQAESLPH